MRNFKEGLEVHDTLNPKIWDIKNNKVRPEVREKIFDIVKAFIDELDVDIDVIDIQLVGSNASFNYTDSSDLDVHIIANFDSLSPDEDLVNVVYNLYKSQFNYDHDISLHGVEIELYVQDVHSNIESNGIYSIVIDEWIKFPHRIEPPKFDLTKQINVWSNEIEECLIGGDLKDVQDLIDTLYLLRRNALAVDGEFSEGNQLFKEIRTLGLLDKLKDKKRELQSKELTLEHLNCNK